MLIGGGACEKKYNFGDYTYRSWSISYITEGTSSYNGLMAVCMAILPSDSWCFYAYRVFKNRRDTGSLVIAGILTVYGLFFLINAITAWKYSHMLNFAYPLGIGIGFLESYVMGDRRNSILLIAIVLLVISFYKFLDNMLPNFAINYRYYIIPALLVVIGIVVIFKGGSGDNTK